MLTPPLGILEPPFIWENQDGSAFRLRFKTVHLISSNLDRNCQEGSFESVLMRRVRQRIPEPCRPPRFTEQAATGAGSRSADGKYHAPNLHDAD